jgi:Tol biopolymer transport system component
VAAVIGSLTAQVLRGTEAAGAPFWSPDSRTLAFVSGGTLKTTATSGGQATTIANRVPGTRGTWNREGVILIGSQVGKDSPGGIQRTSARGGAPTPATTVDTASGETNHDFPFFLPDGRHFLYVAWSRQPQSRALYVGALDSAERKRLMPAESMVVYSDGQLLFLRSRSLMAQAFDARRLELTGEPHVVAENIPTNPLVGGAAFNASTNDTLIYRTGSGIETEGRKLSWFDRQGKSLGELGAPDSYSWVKLSNDGKRVATQLTDSAGNADVWVIDIDRGARSRVTFDPAVDGFPNWSADGRTVFFGSLRNGKYAIYQTSSTGTGGERLFHGNPDTSTLLGDVSVDGRYVVYGTSKEENSQRDLWVLPTSGDGKAFPFVQTPFVEYSPAVSPDDRWMAYTTNESGGPQVVVQSFPDPSRAKYPVSINGGSEPRWRRDGKELYYVAPDHKLMAVKISGDRELEVGTPVALFDTPIPFPRNDGAQAQRYYDVTADGQRFLINAPRAQTNPSPITVMLNWTAGLKR